MRVKTVLLSLFLVLSFAVAQDPAAPQPKYGVKPLLDLYPQAKLPEALNSVIRAVEKDKIEYLAAHLLEPKFIEARIDDRAKQMEAVVDKELRLKRDQQIQMGIPARERIPSDPKDFTAAVQEESRLRAFRLVVRDIRAHLTENPEHLRELKKHARIGVVVDTGEVGSMALKDAKDLQLNFKKLDGRWYLEDRKSAEAPEKNKK
jgi:hypothetical protein